jgi:hypothetical protein
MAAADPTSPSYFEQRADEARQLAENAGSQSTRKHWLDIANHWERMARSAESLQRVLAEIERHRRSFESDDVPNDDVRQSQ